jgi:hypothetical protein
MLLKSLSEQQALIISIRTNQALPSRSAPAFSMPLTPILPEEEGE